MISKLSPPHLSRSFSRHESSNARDSFYQQVLWSKSYSLI